MSTPRRHLGHTYRLVLSEDGRGIPRTIEFNATSADGALYVAERQCNGREAELFEDNRRLGTLKNKRGFWMLSSSDPKAAQA